MTFGGILGEAWELYTKFFKRFFVIALIVFGIVNLLNALVATLFGSGAGIAVLLALITDVVALVGTFWLQGALVYAVDDVRDGKVDTTVGQIFERVRPYLWTLILAGVLAGLGITVGLILLIVPGLILLTWWCLMVPVIVLEEKGVGEAFGRSRELVRGHAWTVFGVVIVAGILSGVRRRDHPGGLLVLRHVPPHLGRRHDLQRHRRPVRRDRADAHVLHAPRSEGGACRG